MVALWRLIGGTFAARVFTAAANFAILILSARMLGVEGRGQIASVIAWTTLFAGFFGISIGAVIAHRMTQDNTPAEVGRLCGALFPITLLFTVFAWAAAWVIVQSGLQALTVLPAILLLVGFGMVPFIILDDYVKHLLTVTQKLRLYNVNSIASRIAGLASALAVLFLTDWGAVGIVLAIGIMYVVTVGLGAIQLWSEVRDHIQVRLADSLRLIGDGLKLHINTLGSFLLFHMDLIMLGQFQSIKTVGWYETAVYLISLPLLLPAIVTLVFYSKIAELGVDRAWDIQKRLMLQIMGIMLTMAILLYWLAGWVIPFLFGVSFQNSVPIFQILLIAMLGMGFSQLMVAQWISRGLFLQAGAITICAGLINVTLNYLYIPVYGMYAAAWTSVGAFGLSIIANAIFVVWVERRVRARQSSAGQSPGGHVQTGRAEG